MFARNCDSGIAYHKIDGIKISCKKMQEKEFLAELGFFFGYLFLVDPVRHGTIMVKKTTIKDHDVIKMSLT